jgi:hypothetical protein
VGLPTRSQKDKLNLARKLARVGTALAHIRIGAERAGSTASSLLIYFQRSKLQRLRRSRNIFAPAIPLDAA